MKRLTLLVSLILLGCSSAFAACTGSSPTWTTTPDQASVQTCINNASNGDTVNVSAGSASWTSVTLSKDITLNGAGQGVTSGLPITAAGGVTTSCASSGTCIDVSGGNPAFTITLSTSGNTRINNFAFLVENNGNLPHTIEINGNWPTSYGLIWENDTFTVNNGTVIDNYLPGGVIFSGITFNGNWNDFFMTIKDDSSYVSWTTYADTIGNRDTTGLYNNYIENSTFNGGSNGVLDCDDNCRMVLRNNTFNESGGFNSHGDDSSPVGMRHFEIYNNSFNFPDMTCAGGTTSLSNINQYIWLRGGTGVIYSNTFVGLDSTCWGDKPEIRGSIRGIQDDLAFLPPAYTTRIASCGAVTYPAPNQLGQNFNGTSLFTDPIYTWGNSGNLDGGGFHVEFATGFVDFGGGANPCSFTWSTFFQWGRDAVNTTVGSNTCDTTGCSVDVGLGGDTAKSGYTAYTYPHPLTVSSVITLNDASNAGCIISATNPCPRAGINVGQPSGSQPQFKNLLQFANPGFEPLQMKQVYQFQTIPCTFCSVSTFQWNLNNTQFEGYDANQWAGANFNVVQGCYVGTTGCTGGGTSDPAFGCTGTIASSTNVGGAGPQFATSAPCPGTLGLAGQVIIVSSQNSMANVLGTTHGWPTSQSTSGTASITADTTDLCATCGVQAAHLTASAGGTATLTVLNTAATVGGAEKTLTLNGTYTISFWAKLNSGSTTAITANLIVRNGGACTGSGCNFVPTMTSGSWVKYSTTEALSETASPSDPFNYALSIKLTGAADAYVDNLAFVEPGTNPTVYSDNFVKALQTWCQSVVNSTGPGCTLRYGPSPDSETMADWVKSDSTRQPTAESYSTNFTNGYFTQKTGLYDWFTLNQAVGSIPVLIIPVTMTTADVANLVDYLEDNTGATTYGAIRQAQGQTTAWVGQAGSPFGVIYLEYGNENWNGAFLGHVLTSHSNNPNNYYDYAVRMGVVLAAARARQAAQSYSTAVTQWIANGLTGNTTDFKYLTAYVGGQLTYSGGTITPVQGTEDAIEFQRYYGINIATVSTTGCTTNNASCPLYGPTEAETWSDFSDTSSTSGYQQSMAAIQAINFCGAAHTATCKAATYEGGMSPDGASTSTSGPFTQAVSDSFTPAGWHLSTDAVGYQLASQNSFAFTNEYQALQYYIGQGGVNVKIWGSMIDYGGDSSVTNSAKWGGVLVSGRPQMAAAMVTNYCKIGQEVTTTGSSMPTYALASNSNGVHANGSVPYLVFNEYSFGAQRCILVTNTDLVSSHTVTLAGTNVPTTVTQYQAASPTQSSTNEAANLGNTSTTASTVYPVLTAGVNVGSGFTAPPMSTTALLFNTSGSPLVTVNFNSRAGGTAVAAGLAGSNCTAISASSRFDLLQAAGMNHCRLFVDINQDCPAGVCGSWSIPLGQLKLIAARGLKATVVVYNSPSNLGTNPCNPPSNNTTWAGYVNTGLALFATDYPGTVDSVELWNETDIGTVGGTSGNWCPATGTLLGAYESMIAVVGPSIASTNPSLTVGGPALGSAADAATWIPGVIGAWSGIGFISYHLYLSSTCASWAACWSGMQNTSSGITFWDNQIASLVTGAGSSAPVWLTEYNDGYAFSTDCCRFDTTYSAQWNTLAIVDHLSATTLPARLNYFTNESTGWFCLDGNISGAICANGAPLATYPPWYAYLLVNTDLNLAPGGHLASSISPGATVSGVSAAAWYHSTGDSLLIVNPTSSAATSQPITINNTGFSNAIGTQFLLNAANGTITQSPLSLTSTGGTSYSATVTVGANSTLGILLAPPPPTKLTAVKLSGGVEVQ